MDISFDTAKREATMAHRGLDFADADKMFVSRHVTVRDERRDYGEERLITAGFLNGRRVVMVWTVRAGTRRVISMRYAHDKEHAGWFGDLDRPG